MEKTINGHTKEEAITLAFKLGFESEKNRTSCSQSSFHAITTVLGYKMCIRDRYCFYSSQ